jgi:glycosyltransferase involved in cell wall biosynthesis
MPVMRARFIGSPEAFRPFEATFYGRWGEMGPQVSVVVTTYNKERELSLVLEGYKSQKFNDFELLVADDGSGPKTKEVVERAREGASFEIRHCWQEDRGFRAAEARNLAIRSARGEIVFMTDGDCVPLPETLEMLVKDFPARGYRAGERYLLSQEVAAGVTVDLIRSGGGDYLKSLIPAAEEKRVRSIRRKNWYYRTFGLKVRPTVMTCNLAVRRRDLLEVNGFDQRYVGWGHEDTDLGRRLRRRGIVCPEALSPAVVLHLWHKTEGTFAGRVRDCPNAKYFDRGFYLSRCRMGLEVRSYESLGMSVCAVDEGLRAEATRVLGSGGSEIEVLLLPDGRVPRRAAGVEASVLVLGPGVLASPSLLKGVGLVFLKGGMRELAGFGGEVHELKEAGFGEEGLKEIRRRLEEVL